MSDHKEIAIELLQTLSKRITEDLQTGVRRTSLAYVKGEVEKTVAHLLEI